MARTNRNSRSIVVRIIPSDVEYNIITIPREHRRFFPGYKIEFDLQRNNAGVGMAWMTSRSEEADIGEEEAGKYICGRLRKWYDSNRVRVDDYARITRLDKAISPGRLAYRLEHLSTR